MARIFLVRIPETEANREYRLGSWDIKSLQSSGSYPDDWKRTCLTPRGIWQAERLRDRLERYEIDAFYSTPIEAGFEAACIIAQPHIEQGLKSVQEQVAIEGAFAEIDLPDWANRPRDELNQIPDYREFSGLEDPHKSYAGGESWEAAQTRFIACLQKVVRQHKGQSVCIVSHGGVIRAGICQLLGMDLRRLSEIQQFNTALNLFEYDAEGSNSTRFHCINDISHIEAEEFAESVGGQPWAGVPFHLHAEQRKFQQSLSSLHQSGDVYHLLGQTLLDLTKCRFVRFLINDPQLGDTPRYVGLAKLGLPDTKGEGKQAKGILVNHQTEAADRILRATPEPFDPEDIPLCTSESDPQKGTENITNEAVLHAAEILRIAWHRAEMQRIYTGSSPCNVDGFANGSNDKPTPFDHAKALIDQTLLHLQHNDTVAEVRPALAKTELRELCSNEGIVGFLADRQQREHLTKNLRQWRRAVDDVEMVLVCHTVRLRDVPDRGVREVTFFFDAKDAMPVALSAESIALLTQNTKEHYEKRYEGFILKRPLPFLRGLCNYTVRELLKKLIGTANARIAEALQWQEDELSDWRDLPLTKEDILQQLTRRFRNRLHLLPTHPRKYSLEEREKPNSPIDFDALAYEFYGFDVLDIRLHQIFYESARHYHFRHIASYRDLCIRLSKRSSDSFDANGFLQADGICELVRDIFEDAIKRHKDSTDEDKEEARQELYEWLIKALTRGKGQDKSENMEWEELKGSLDEEDSFINRILKHDERWRQRHESYLEDLTVRLKEFSHLTHAVDCQPLLLSDLEDLKKNGQNWNALLVNLALIELYLQRIYLRIPQDLDQGIASLSMERGAEGGFEGRIHCVSEYPARTTGNLRYKMLTTLEKYFGYGGTFGPEAQDKTCDACNECGLLRYDTYAAFYPLIAKGQRQGFFVAVGVRPEWLDVPQKLRSECSEEHWKAQRERWIQTRLDLHYEAVRAVAPAAALDILSGYRKLFVQHLVEDTLGTKRSSGTGLSEDEFHLYVIKNLHYVSNAVWTAFWDNQEGIWKEAIPKFVQGDVSDKEHKAAWNYECDVPGIGEKTGRIAKAEAYKEYCKDSNNPTVFRTYLNDLDLGKPNDRKFVVVERAKFEQQIGLLNGTTPTSAVKSDVAQWRSCLLMPFSTKNEDGTSKVEGIYEMFFEEDASMVREFAQDLMVLLNNAYAVQQSVRRVSQEMLRGGTKSAIAAIMSRNMSHNIGSHALFYIGRDEQEEAQRLKDIAIANQHIRADYAETQRVRSNEYLSRTHFYDYLRQRMDFVAATATATPIWTSSMKMADFVNGMKAEAYVLNHETNGYDLKKSASLLLRKIVLSEAINNVEIDCRGNDQLVVAIPGSLLGFQAFYAILENIIRDGAKYGQRNNDHSTEEMSLTIDISDMQDENWPDYVRVAVIDGLSPGDKAADIQARIEELRINGLCDRRSGEISHENWGIKERYIAATWLRGRAVEDELTVSREKTHTDLPILEVKDENGLLAWTFYLMKPKDVLIISDVLTQDQITADGVDVRTWEWLKSHVVSPILRHSIVVLSIPCESKADAIKWLRKEITHLPARIGILDDGRVDFSSDLGEFVKKVCPIRLPDWRSESLFIDFYHQWVSFLWQQKHGGKSEDAALPQIVLLGDGVSWEDEERCLRINSQADSGRRQLIFDSHARSYKSIIAPFFYEAHASHYRIRSLIDELKADCKKLAENPSPTEIVAAFSRLSRTSLGLIEASLVSVLIVDEREDPSLESLKISIETETYAMRELLSRKGVYCEGAEYRETQMRDKALLLEWCQDDKGMPYDFVLVHWGIIDKICGGGSDKFRRAEDLIVEMKQRGVGEILIHSGRGQPYLPEGVKFLHLSSINSWISKNASKYEIVQDLMALRRRQSS